MDSRTTRIEDIQVEPDAPQLDKDVCDVGDSDAEPGGVPDRRLVVAVLPESGEEVLPLQDRDVDKLRFGWAGGFSGFLRAFLSSGTVAVAS